MRIRRGPLFMIAAGLAFTIMIAAVKIAREELGAFDVVLWRAGASVPIALAFAWRGGLRIHNRRAMVLRSLLGFGAMSCFFTAAKGLSLADLSLIGKLQPILVAFAAPWVLGRSERASRLVWIVLVCGIAGTALIISPDLKVGSFYGLWAIGATVCSAGAHITVRALSRTDKVGAIVFWYHALATVFALVALVIASHGVPALPPLHLLPHLIVAGGMAAVGQLLMTRAYSLERAAPVAAASYATVLFGFVGDLIVFTQWPSLFAIIGGVLVVGGGLLLIFGPHSAPESAMVSDA